MEEKDSVTHLESKRLRPGSPTARRSNSTLTPSLDNTRKTGMDLRLEVEVWKFMKSIIPSKHQEMIHLQEGAWRQNDYANNLGQFTASQQENHPTNNALPESKKDKQESGRYHPHKKSFNTSTSPNTEEINKTKRTTNIGTIPQRWNKTTVHSNEYPTDGQLVQQVTKQPR